MAARWRRAWKSGPWGRAGWPWCRRSKGGARYLRAPSACSLTGLYSCSSMDFVHSALHEYNHVDSAHFGDELRFLPGRRRGRWPDQPEDRLPRVLSEQLSAGGGCAVAGGEHRLFVREVVVVGAVIALAVGQRDSRIRYTGP